MGCQLFQGTISYLQAEKSIQLSSTAVLEAATGTLEQVAQPLHIKAHSEGKPAWPKLHTPWEWIPMFAVSSGICNPGSWACGRGSTHRNNPSKQSCFYCGLWVFPLGVNHWVFLSYSQMQKGYCLTQPDTNSGGCCWAARWHDGVLILSTRSTDHDQYMISLIKKACAQPACVTFFAGWPHPCGWAHALPVVGIALGFAGTLASQRAVGAVLVRPASWKDRSVWKRVNASPCLMAVLQKSLLANVWTEIEGIETNVSIQGKMQTW